LFAYPFFVASALCKGERLPSYNPQGMMVKLGSETQWKKYLNPVIIHPNWCYASGGVLLVHTLAIIQEPPKN